MLYAIKKVEMWDQSPSVHEIQFIPVPPPTMRVQCSCLVFLLVTSSQLLVEIENKILWKGHNWNQQTINWFQGKPHLWLWSDFSAWEENNLAHFMFCEMKCNSQACFIFGAVFVSSPLRLPKSTHHEAHLDFFIHGAYFVLWCIRRPEKVRALNDTVC